MELSFDVVVLAGGRGKRMDSGLPKTLHPVGGIPTLARILASVSPLARHPIVVVGDRAAEVIGTAGRHCRFVFQEEQRGTGHAVRCVKNSISEHLLQKNIMILPGDHPLIDARTVASLAESHERSGATVTFCTLTIPDFLGNNMMFFDYGRIRRTARGDPAEIVEVRDASKKEKEIKEVNVGYYCFRTSWLWEHIGDLTNENAAGEFYITDLLRIAIAGHAPTNVYRLEDPRQGMGFNTPEQLDVIRRCALG